MATTTQLQYSGGSMTSVIEMQSFSKKREDDAPLSQGRLSASRDSASSRRQDREPMSPLPAPSTATEVAERWNQSKLQIFRVSSAMFSFIVLGNNDAAYGALIGYIAIYYDLTYTVVSLLFLSPFAGYVMSALINNWTHMKVGQRGVAIAVAICHIVAYVVIAIHPPYPVLVLSFALAGFGNGLADAAWNAWLGNMANSNEVLGFLHGFYGLGAVISPLIATTLVTQAHVEWYYFYYFMIGMAVVELGVTTAAFWSATAEKYRESLSTGVSEDHKHTLKDALWKAPFARVTWVCALFLLGYVGTEVTLGGWIVVFMQKVRNGADYASGMTAMGFWLGLTVGRVTLGFITPRIGPKLAICIYLGLVVALELIFWLVPQFYVSAVAVGLQGFFLGPLFPAAIVVATRLLPRRMHVSAIGFAAAVGGGGAAVLPFMAGAIAQAKGVASLQPVVLAFIVFISLMWLALPRIRNKNE